MKHINKNLKVIATAAVAVTLLFSTSCTKDENEPTTHPALTGEVKSLKDKDDQKSVSATVDRAPSIAWYNSTMDKIITINPRSQQKSFSFSDPNPGWNFSDASETTWVPAENGGGILFIGAGSFGSNTGGTVVAGNSTVNINHTFCFSASDEAIGFDFGTDGPELDGVSMVIGIGGDFEALTTGEFDEEDDIFDFFTGIAAYIVYDNEANGTYPILNWFDDLMEEPDDLENKGFAYVYAFQEPAGIYFSESGSLNVSGGQISFEGTYWGITGNIFDWFDTEDDFEFVEVDGFGTMGCN